LVGNFICSYYQIQNRLAKSAQQSVHWTLGILRHFQAFFWLQFFSCSQAESTPAPAPVTQAVGLSRKYAAPLDKVVIMLKMKKRIIIIIVLVLFLPALGCQESLNTNSSSPTATVTFTPSPTFTPTPPSRVIPSNYYRIVTTKQTYSLRDESALICMRTNTHIIAEAINDKIVQINASSSYQSVLGDCNIGPEQWSYVLTVHEGKFVAGEKSNLEYYGSDYRGLVEDVFTLSGSPIPVWKVTYPTYRRDFLGKPIAYEGTAESWVDKATGVVVYQMETLVSVYDPARKIIFETVGLSTNAPIGEVSNGADFTY
jgi:hypothetical protein